MAPKSIPRSGNSNPAPEFKVDYITAFAVEIPIAKDDEPLVSSEVGQVSDQVTAQVTAQVSDQVKKLVLTIGEDAKNRDEIMELLHLKHRENFRLTYTAPALADGVIAMLFPDKPNSSKQKYYLTEKGKILYKEITENVHR